MASFTSGFDLQIVRAARPLRLAVAALWAALAVPLGSRAQDVIVRSTGERQEAQVLDVRGTDVLYRPWGQPTAPVTVLSTEYVQSILYQTGTRRDFLRASTLPAPAPEQRVNLGRNLVALRPMDLFFGNLTLSYERLVGSSKLIGVKIPATLSLNRDWPTRDGGLFGYATSKTFSAGLEVNFYAGQPGRFRYFFGPALQVGSFKYLAATEYLGRLDFFGLDLGDVYRTEEAVGKSYCMLFNNGIWYQVGQHCIFSADGGLGWQTNFLNSRLKNLGKNNAELTGTHFKPTLNFNFAYQF